MVDQRPINNHPNQFVRVEFWSNIEKESLSINSIGYST
jgi:hypothetical protein